MNPSFAPSLFEAIARFDRSCVSEALEKGSNAKAPFEAEGAISPETPLTMLWKTMASRTYSEEGVAILDDLLRHGAMGLKIGITGRDVLNEALLVLTDEWSGMATQRLIAAGANPHRTDSWGSQPLRLAAERGLLQAARVLIDAGVNVNQSDAHQQTVLMSACAEGHVAMLDLLASHGANLNEVDEVGNTALLSSAAAIAWATGQNDEVEKHKRMAVFVRLLEHGALPAIANEKGITALLVMAGLAHSSAVDRLLEAGAPVNAADEEGTTPLMALANARIRPDDPGLARFPEAILKTALALHLAGADASARNALGQTADDLVRKRGRQALNEVWAEAAAQAAVFYQPRLDEEGGVEAAPPPRRLLLGAP